VDKPEIDVPYRCSMKNALGDSGVEVSDLKANGPGTI